LLVIVGAALWLPVSFGVATAMHAALLAGATTLPAWMQLLHPLATIIAKTKLLVLPAYPAAWPQAKKHPLVGGLARLYRYLMSLRLARKAGCRYRQAEQVAATAVAALGRAAAFAGLGTLSHVLLAGLAAAAARIGMVARAAMRRTVEVLSSAPLIGSVVKKYSEHYDGAGRHRERVSQRMSESLRHWSIKFSAEYYEAKEREQAAGAHPELARAPTLSAPRDRSGRRP
jgi:hypothetical protein